MLAEFEAIIERLPASSRDAAEADLRSAARALLDRQFVFADDFQGKRRFETVRKHKAYFTALFDVLGFDLVIDDREQVVGIVNQAGAAPRRMHLDETTFLVALRVVYETRVKEFMLGDSGRAETTLAEVWNLIEERTRRSRPGPGRCRAIAESFSRNGLVKVLDPLPDGDLGLEIRPSIAKAVTAATAETLEQWARGEEGGPGGSDEQAEEEGP